MNNPRQIHCIQAATSVEMFRRFRCQYVFVVAIACPVDGCTKPFTITYYMNVRWHRKSSVHAVMYWYTVFQIDSQYFSMWEHAVFAVCKRYVPKCRNATFAALPRIQTHALKRANLHAAWLLILRPSFKCLGESVQIYMAATKLDGIHINKDTAPYTRICTVFKWSGCAVSAFFFVSILQNRFVSFLLV